MKASGAFISVNQEEHSPPRPARCLKGACCLHSLLQGTNENCGVIEGSTPKSDIPSGRTR